MEPIKTILDTDIGGDVDDAAAVAMMNVWAQEGRVEPLAMIVCISSRWSAGAVDAINRYFDHPDIPVGTNRRSRVLDQELAKRIPGISPNTTRTGIGPSMRRTRSAFTAACWPPSRTAACRLSASAC